MKKMKMEMFILVKNLLKLKNWSGRCKVILLTHSNIHTFFKLNLITYKPQLIIISKKVCKITI